MRRGGGSETVLPPPTPAGSGVTPAAPADSSALGRPRDPQGRDYSLAILKIIAKAAKMPARPCPLMMGAV